MSLPSHHASVRQGRRLTGLAWTGRLANRPVITALTFTVTVLPAAAFAVPAQAAAPQYRLTLSAIAALEYTQVNDNGDILGCALQPGTGLQVPFLLKAGSSTPVFLNAPASQASEDTIVTAAGFNEAGTVVGSSDTGEFTALEWPGSSTPTDLSQLPPLATTLFDTQAMGINDNGLIVGFGQNVHDADIPFTIQGGSVAQIPELLNGVDAQPSAVSDTGIIVGDADTATADALAVEWVSGAIKKFPSLPHTLTSQALAVNNSGEAVGAAVLTSDFNAHAVLWANGKATDLHFPGDSDAEATGINASGVIVGDNSSDAFIDQNGTVTDLNSLIPAGSGVTLVTAAGINDQGDIVGTAVDASGGEIGYELTPVG